jgi:diguanylate cyclase (GGDEF)-like protein
MRLTGLRSRLWLLVGSLIAAIVVMAVAAHLLQARANDTLHTVYADRVVPMQQLKAVSDAYAVTVVDSAHKARDGTLALSGAADRIDAAMIEADRVWADYLLTSLTSEERTLVDQAEVRLTVAREAAGDALTLLRADDIEAIRRYAATDMYPRIDPLSEVLDDLVALQENEAERLFVEADRSERAVERSLFAATAITLLLGSASSIALIRSVTSPVGQVLRMARAVADGALETSTHLPAGAATETVELMHAVEQMRDRLVELADSDALTGLVTRRRLDQVLEREAEHACRTGLPYVVVVVDLDHFKSVNDTHGHAAGDAVLVAAARTMTDHLRAVDLLARHGGEEFVVLLPGLDLDAALPIAERMRSAIQGDVVMHGAARVAYTASFGLAASDAEQRHGPADVLGRADRALYEAKRLGRNRVVTDPSLGGRSTG